MRRLRMVLVLVSLFVLTGDVRVPLPEQFPGAFNAVRFWYTRKGDYRAVLSVPADERLSNLYELALLRAQKLGLSPEPPRLRQTKPELILILGLGIRYIFAVHYAGPRIILVNTWWTDQMSDREVEMLLAHEIVHAADLQSERRGVLLDLFSPGADEDFVADSLATLMFEPGEYNAFQKKMFVDNQER